jgi:hypothetical protein
MEDEFSGALVENYNLSTHNRERGEGYINAYNFCSLPLFTKELFFFLQNEYHRASWLLDCKSGV